MKSQHVTSSYGVQLASPAARHSRHAHDARSRLAHYPPPLNPVPTDGHSTESNTRLSIDNLYSP